jgi:hypothetical protein
MSDPTISSIYNNNLSGGLKTIADSGHGTKFTSGQGVLLNDLLAKYYNYANQKQPSYTGELTAPLGSVQTDAISNLLNYKSPSSGLESLSYQTIQDLISGKTGMADALTKNYETNIEQPLTKVYNDQIMPNIANTFASKGLSYGSSRSDATIAESQTLMDSLAKGRAQLGADITKSSLDAQISGLNSLNELDKTSLAKILGLTSAATQLGAQEQNTQQLSDSASYQQWLKQQPGNSDIDKMLLQILGLSATNTNVNGGGTNNNAANANSAISAVGTGVSTAGTIASAAAAAY